MEVTKYTAEETATNRQKWVDALRSGDYRQGQAFLHRDSEFCCLGVACVVALEAGLEMEVTPNDLEGTIYYGGRDTTLPLEVRGWLGLADDVGSLVDTTTADDNLWKLNDWAHMSFKEIADVIESGGVQLGDG